MTVGNIISAQTEGRREACVTEGLLNVRADEAAMEGGSGLIA